MKATKMRVMAKTLSFNGLGQRSGSAIVLVVLALPLQKIFC